MRSPRPTKTARGASSVLLAGHVTLDRTAVGVIPGGSAYYAARAYLGLGARVRVCTAAGSDFPLGALAGALVDVAPAERTTRFANTYAPDGERAQLVEAVAPPLTPERLPAEWRSPGLLHLAPVLAEVDLQAWRRAARARFCGVGVQGWVRAVAPGGAVVQPRWEVSAQDLCGVDAACVSEEDLCGQGDLLDRLAAAVPVVALTKGASGCEILARGRRARVGTFPTREVDPTGAGDVFAAAFFLALARGADPVAAAREGAAAASIVVEGLGGEALARIAEARARVARVPVL
jgi:1D-myo-inositol 3-kinase